MKTQRSVAPRTLALDRCDGVGVPEITSRVPRLPIRDRMRRMRGAPSDGGITKRPQCSGKAYCVDIVVYTVGLPL